MALVFIPTMMQNLTDGTAQVQIEGRTVRAIINHLEERFPGMKERLFQDGDIRPDIAVAVDGEVSFDLTDRVNDDSEVHFVPPISGGCGMRNAECGMRNAEWGRRGDMGVPYALGFAVSGGFDGRDDDGDQGVAFVH